MMPFVFQCLLWTTPCPFQACSNGPARMGNSAALKSFSFQRRLFKTWSWREMQVFYSLKFPHLYRTLRKFFSWWSSLGFFIKQVAPILKFRTLMACFILHVSQLQATTYGSHRKDSWLPKLNADDVDFKQLRKTSRKMRTWSYHSIQFLDHFVSVSGPIL